MATIAIDIPEARIAAFCKKWKIRNLEFFGSVLRDDFGPESDIDVLVTFEPGGLPSLFGLVEAEFELQDIFGRRVDLLERSGVERSENWIRRRRILESAQLIYG